MSLLLLSVHFNLSHTTCPLSLLLLISLLYILTIFVQCVHCSLFGYVDVRFFFSIQQSYGWNDVCFHCPILQFSNQFYHFSKHFHFQYYIHTSYIYTNIYIHHNIKPPDFHVFNFVSLSVAARVLPFVIAHEHCMQNCTQCGDVVVIRCVDMNRLCADWQTFL